MSLKDEVMVRKAALLILFFLMIGSRAFGGAQHPIDAKLTGCLSTKEGMTTAGMLNCTNEAAVAWDKAMNDSYLQLVTKSDEMGKEQLKLSQRAWLKFRDLEYKNIDAVYKNLRGTMYIPMRAMSRLAITKNRAAELQEYVQLSNP
jgi:uncharacterized protein YecT (DUF1311 family)